MREVQRAARRYGNNLDIYGLNNLAATRFVWTHHDGRVDNDHTHGRNLVRDPRYIREWAAGGGYRFGRRGTRVDDQRRAAADRRRPCTPCPGEGRRGAAGGACSAAARRSGGDPVRRRQP